MQIFKSKSFWTAVTASVAALSAYFTGEATLGGAAMTVIGAWMAFLTARKIESRVVGGKS